MEGPRRATFAGRAEGEEMSDRQYDVVAAMVMNDEQKAN
jgi:hypothetical protein